MELDPKLSLAPTQFVNANKSGTTSSTTNNIISSLLEPETNYSSRKRKLFHDHHPHNHHHHHHHHHNHVIKTQPPVHQASDDHVDLHLKDPLPLDWEQCLDLESGKMYYLNRKTLKKSWNWPMDRKALDLGLSNTNHQLSDCKSQLEHEEELDTNFKKQYNSSSSPSSSSSSGGSMVALACLNCHLLVILSKSSPSCPNCKYVHSLPSLNHQQYHQADTNPKVSAVKSLNTLSLLN